MGCDGGKSVVRRFVAGYPDSFAITNKCVEVSRVRGQYLVGEFADITSLQRFVAPSAHIPFHTPVSFHWQTSIPPIMWARDIFLAASLMLPIIAVPTPANNVSCRRIDLSSVLSDRWCRLKRGQFLILKTQANGLYPAQFEISRSDIWHTRRFHPYLQSMWSTMIREILKQAKLAPRDTLEYRMVVPRDTSEYRMVVPRDTSEYRMVVPRDTSEYRMVVPRDMSECPTVAHDAQ